MKFIFLPIFVSIIFGSILISTSKENDKSEAYVFVSSALVRTTPSIESNNVSDKLNTGHKVIILNKEELIYTLNGVSNYWYKISYISSGTTKQGFIWGGLLAFDCIKYGNDNLIVIGITSFKPNAGYTLSIKILHDNSLLSNMPFILFSKEPQQINSFSNLKIDFYDNLGFSYFDNILKVSLNNVPDYERQNRAIIGIKNNSSIYIAKEEYQGQAGVGHYYGSYIFPNEKDGQSDCIVYKFIEYKFDDKLNKDIIVKNNKKVFIWDSEKAQLISK